MKRKSSYLAKTLSIFLAVIMCLSVCMMDWSGIMLPKADAFAAGSYHVLIQVNVTNTDSDSSDSYIQWWGKGNNGTAGETYVGQYGFNGRSGGVQTVYDQWTSYFPSRMYAHSYVGSNPSYGYSYTCYVYNASNSAVTIMSGSDGKTSGTGSWTGSQTVNNNGTWPAYSSMGDSGATSYTLNAAGGSSSTGVYTFAPKDQFGVQLACTPSWSLSDANYSDAYINTTSGDSTTLTLPATPRNMARTTISLTGSFNFGGTRTKTWTITVTPTYKINFNAATNGGALSGAPSSVNVTNGTTSSTISYTIPSNYLATKSGWTFLGWNTSSTATSGHTTAGSARSGIGYNTTLYAMFSRAITNRYYYTTASNNTLTTTNSVTSSGTAYNAATSISLGVPAASAVTTKYTQDDKTYELLGWQGEGATAQNLVSYTTTPGIGFGTNVNVATTSSAHNFYPTYRLYSTKFYATFNYYTDGQVAASQTKDVTVLAPNASGAMPLPTGDSVEFYIKDGKRYQLQGWSTTQGATVPDIVYGGNTATLNIPANNTTPIQYYPIYALYSTIIFANFHYFDASANDTYKQMTGNCFVPATSAGVTFPATSDVLTSYVKAGRTYTLLGWRTTSMGATEYLPYGSSLEFNLPPNNLIPYDLYPVYTSVTKATFYSYTAAGAQTSLTKSVNEFDSVNGGYNKNTIVMPVAQSSEINTSITLDGRTFTFCGWRKDVTSAAQTVLPSVTQETLNITDTIYNYYAIYKSDALTLSYNGIYGAPIPASQSATQYINAGTGTTANVNNASSYTFTINPSNVTPEKTGYTYIGWQNANLAETETATYTKTGATYTTKVNHTLYAVYSINDMTINFVYHNGDEYVTVSKYIKYDDQTRSDSGAARYSCDAPTMDTSVINHADVKNHYYFSGWMRSDGKALETSVNGNIYNLKVRFAVTNVTVQALYKAVAHHWVTVPDTTTEPTCTTDGKYNRQCVDCGYVEQNVVIPKLGHLPYEEGYKAATCEEDGHTVTTYCSRCNQVIIPATVIPATGHDFETTVVAPTCTEQGYTLYVCKNNNAHKYKDDFTPEGGHSFTILVEGTPATCTQSGLSDYKVCSICGAQNVAQAIIPKLGHSMTKHAALAATCTADGNILYYECANCLKLFADKNGQTEIADANGDSVITVEDTVIAALGHNYETQNEVEATCTTPGHSAGYCCTRCGEGEQVIVYPALGHDFEGVEPIIVESTCTVNGTSTMVCARCGDSVVSELDLKDHTVETVAAVPATCTDYGKTEWTKCSVCDKVLTSFEYTPKIAHDFSIVTAEAVAPTCTIDGSTAAVKCSVCDLEKPAVVIPATGHSFGSWKVSVPATCGVAGEKQRACLVCKEVETMATAALEHNYVAVAEVPATCTESGFTAGYKCTLCGNVQSGIEVINALGHDLGEPIVTVAPTCTSTGISVKYCSRCDIAEVTELNKLSHTEVTIPAVAATCSSIGYTAGVKCSVCNNILVKPVAVAKLPHTATTVAGVPATCTEGGSSDYTVCSVCGLQLTLPTVIQATGHSLSGWSIDVEATCSRDGRRIRTCQNPGCNYYEEKILPAIGHNIVNDAPVAATCTTTGLTAGSHCTRCNEKTVAQVVVPALGHDLYSNVVAPTCTLDGYTILTCERCDYTEKTAPVAATGHTGGTATCTNKAICSVCNEPYGELLAHSYTSVDFAGNCSTKSRTVYTCVCGDTYTVQGAYGDHEYIASTATIVVAPTCTANGKSENICQICGKTAEFTVLATGHIDTNVDGYCDTCNFDLDPGSHGVDVGACDLCGRNHNGQIGGFFGKDGFMCKMVQFFHTVRNMFG